MNEEHKNSVAIGKLETKVDALHNNVDRILNNHLPHLQEDIKGVQLRIAYWVGGTTAILAALQLIIKYLK